jgi:hypothetical protein
MAAARVPTDDSYDAQDSLRARLTAVCFDGRWE